MKRGMECRLGRPASSNGALCVLPHFVRNIRNIDIYKKNNQQNQVVTSGNPFHQHRNITDGTGTESFLFVRTNFLKPEHRTNPSSLSATRVSGNFEKSLFRLLPVAPEHFQNAESPERRGLQTLLPTNVPDVPDVPGAYAEFLFFRAFLPAS